MPYWLNRPTARARKSIVVAFCSSGSTSDVRQASGDIHRDVNLLIAGASRTALTAVAGDAVADTLESGQLLGVDMDHVARLLPLVPLHRRLWLEIPQPSEAQSLHRPRDSR